MTMRIDVDDLGLGEVEKVVNYAKWKRATRLADWRILAVLMVLVGILASSFFPSYLNGNSIWKVIFFSERLTWSFFYALVFVILWCVSLFWIIADRGFKSVKASGIFFMSYHVFGFLVNSIVILVELSRRSKDPVPWRTTFKYLEPGTGFRMMFLLGLVLLFMGLCFAAQRELEKMNVKTK